MTETLVQITAPHFCAGVVIRRQRVCYTAPILHYMQGWSLNRIKNYCGGRGWRPEVIKIDEAMRRSRDHYGD